MPGEEDDRRHVVAGRHPRLAAEAANALRQADPDRDGAQGMGARVRGVVAVLGGNAWLTARIFGAVQKAEKHHAAVGYLEEQATGRAVADALGG